jgi:hypothetical protein
VVVRKSDPEPDPLPAPSVAEVVESSEPTKPGLLSTNDNQAAGVVTPARWWLYREEGQKKRQSQVVEEDLVDLLSLRPRGTN